MNWFSCISQLIFNANISSPYPKTPIADEAVYNAGIKCLSKLYDEQYVSWNNLEHSPIHHVIIYKCDIIPYDEQEMHFYRFPVEQNVRYSSKVPTNIRLVYKANFLAYYPKYDVFFFDKAILLDIDPVIAKLKYDLELAEPLH